MSSGSDPVSPSPRRGRWRIFLPTILLLLLAGAWTAGWFWAADKAGETIDVLLKREADRGRVYACGERKIGGYPFRIEVDCMKPIARIAVEGGDAIASAPRLVAVAQVWDPSKVIADLSGPVEFSMPDGTRGSLSFGQAQASANAHGQRFERGSLALKTPRLVLGDDEIGSAASVEAHLRRTPDAAAGAYDIAASMEGGVSPLIAELPVGSGPVAAELQAQATGLDDMRPGPLSERLKRFADAGGRATIKLAKVLRGDVAAEAKGDLGLDQEGRLNGALDVTARGVDALVAAAMGGDGENSMAGLLGMGAKLLGKKTELDGKPATRYRLKLDKGKVALGPIKLTRVPPAF